MYLFLCSSELFIQMSKLTGETLGLDGKLICMLTSTASFLLVKCGRKAKITSYAHKFIADLFG